MTRDEAYDMLPSHMRSIIRTWVEEGQPHPNVMGHFMRALLSNDLMGAFSYADTENTIAMRSWVMFLYNHAPSTCYGSIERLHAWYDKHAKKRGEVTP